MLQYNRARKRKHTVSIYTLERLLMSAKRKSSTRSLTMPLVATNRPEAQRLDPDIRRQQILEAAISYFAEAGFAGQTRELSKRIGVTQSLLYRYYPSKQDLI